MLVVLWYCEWLLSAHTPAVPTDPSRQKAVRAAGFFATGTDNPKPMKLNDAQTRWLAFFWLIAAILLLGCKDMPDDRQPGEETAEKPETHRFIAGSETMMVAEGEPRPGVAMATSELRAEAKTSSNFGTTAEAVPSMPGEECARRTGSDMTVLMGKDVARNAGLQQGDSLFATDGTNTLCVGQSKPLQSDTTGAGLTVWGQYILPDGTELAGLKYGEPFNIWLWRDDGTATKLRKVDVTWEVGDGTYSPNAITRVASANIVSAQEPVTTADPIEIGFQQDTVRVSRVDSTWTNSLWVMGDQNRPDPTPHLQVRLTGNITNATPATSNGWANVADTTDIFAFDAILGETFATISGPISSAETVVNLEEVLAYNSSADPIEVSSQNYQMVVLRPIAGDIDGDGQVSFADVVRVLRYIVTRSSPYSRDVLDVNLDGKVNFQDAILTLQAYL